MVLGEHAGADRQGDPRLPGRGVDVDIGRARALVGDKVALQGNLDPCALYGTIGDVERETKKMLLAFGRERHIANLGHGLYPDTEVDKVKCFIETVKGF